MNIKTAIISYNGYSRNLSGCEPDRRNIPVQGISPQLA